jgi:acetyl-CoA acetyltransferase
MGWTSENVAKDFHVTREEQDIFAAESFQKAEHAQKNGYFSEEIVPFTAVQKEPNSAYRIVREDDGIRYGTTVNALSKIRSAFPQWGNGTTTGGNASQITDGAAAVLVMTRREAERRNLPILGRHITTAVTGMSLSTCPSYTNPVS